ncbi:Protein transport protein sec39 [Tolypocladium ophioglossoides CBS 100239]|uniref:Protein transport protein sec39 n=1 Tax=Tolypocladium ophioglossoides (strain CBS 100239) TaxID=1163406 RepID=A0A0L0N371_TOLOC|nr:Protein transport protein sec39 [Tolypocladium ophioglossoides CBS 100239]
MGSALSPAKVLLLAVHLAAHADVEGLGQLSSQHLAVLRKDVLLRILLTHLPETTRPAAYVGFLQEIAAGQPARRPQVELDVSPVSTLSEQQAAKRVKKLRLLQLQCPEAHAQGHGDAISLFLFQRACRMDMETGMLSQLSDLLVPFLSHAPALRTWVVATVLPFVRRNSEYYAETAPAYSLVEFQRLPGPDAIHHLLARTGHGQADQGHIGRDLRGLVGPWLYGKTRWVEVADRDEASGGHDHASSTTVCPGWEQVVLWLTSQATRSWKLTVEIFDQWDGPGDVYFGHGINLTLSEPRQRYLDRSYARAALAAAYTVQEATVDCLGGLYRMSTKIRSLLGHGQGDLPLQDALSALPDMSITDAPAFGSAKTAAFMRSDLLQPQNPLTSSSTTATGLLMALVLSAFISTRLGIPCTVKRAGDLVFLRDEREQRGEVGRLLRAVSNNAPRDDDDYWVRARREVLWLRCWCQEGPSPTSGAAGGVIATVPKQHIESEILKALLSKSRYTLARSLYEDGTEKPLPADVIQDAVYQSALDAFDNASNPNRTRGGLKKCDEIIDSFPVTVGKSLPGTKRIQALLKATHALSDYRLVLKQGEPFSPVVLRVHSDPISIIERVLEQNLKAYTRLQEFLEMGINMVRAGLPSRSRSDKPRASAGSDQDAEMFIVEKRIIAMSVEAALREDDFETAYSYVVSRLDASASSPGRAKDPYDEWSWQAALRAGQYIRTERSQQPTHLGTASGNLEIRHLEQRIECLATALRVAPTCQLQEILKSFRRCEEQLDSAIKEEAANEAAWGAAGDLADLPGAFDAPAADKTYPPRNMMASAAARQADEAPMSLFDLSRATASVAQRNFTALSSLQGVAASMVPANPEPDESAHQRVRKRDQLREAATGTLVSGVGWLIGANVNQG